MKVFILDHYTMYEGGDIKGIFSSYDFAFEYYIENCYKEDSPWTKLLGYHKNIKDCTFYKIVEKEIIK